MSARATVVVLMTASSRLEAERIATALVRERLAACVNVLGPIRSVYRWRGAVERAREVLLLAKTRRARLAALAARVRALHSYDLPEVIALPVIAGARDYLRWVATETTPAARRRAAGRPRRPPPARPQPGGTRVARPGRRPARSSGTQGTTAS